VCVLESENQRWSFYSMVGLTKYGEIERDIFIKKLVFLLF